jgi:cellobiose-specific phosphotransferase system component IIB
MGVHCDAKFTVVRGTALLFLCFASASSLLFIQNFTKYILKNYRAFKIQNLSESKKE